MQTIRRPDILDTRRPEVNVPYENPEQVEGAMGLLGAGCDYGAQLWHELDRVRDYLLEVAGENEKPTQLHGGHDWEAWARVFAEVTSALAGSSGDNGYGVSEARLIAQRNGMQVLG